MNTIRVKMNNTESGRHADFGSIGTYHCTVGNEYDVPADLAQAWIDAGVAMRTKKPATTEGPANEPAKEDEE